MPSNIERDADTKLYFTHPYSSFEKGCNERHNGMIPDLSEKVNLYIIMILTK